MAVETKQSYELNMYCTSITILTHSDQVSSMEYSDACAGQCGHTDLVGHLGQQMEQGEAGRALIGRDVPMEARSVAQNRDLVALQDAVDASGRRRTPRHAQSGQVHHAHAHIARGRTRR